MRAAQAEAFLQGNSAVYPDDVKRVAAAVLSHRLGGGESAAANSMSPEAAVEEILAATAVP